MSDNRYDVLERLAPLFEAPEPSFEGFERRRDRKRRNQRIAAGVVAIAVLVVPAWIVATGGRSDRTQTPGGSGPTASPASQLPTPPGDKISRTVAGVPFSFDVPTTGVPSSDWAPGPVEQLPDGSGFRTGSLFISKSIMGPQGAEAVIFWTAYPDDTRVDPCAGLLGPTVGPTTAALANAVANAPGTELIEGPSDVTVGGYPAKHVVITVRQDLGCDPGFFYTWESECWGPCWMETTVDDTVRVWIVDVDGTRLFIEAETTTQADSELEKEIRQIVGSIRFD
jgi:hypothetical protein